MQTGVSLSYPKNAGRYFSSGSLVHARCLEASTRSATWRDGGLLKKCSSNSPPKTPTTGERSTRIRVCGVYGGMSLLVWSRAPTWRVIRKTRHPHVSACEPKGAPKISGGRWQPPLDFYAHPAGWEILRK